MSEKLNVNKNKNNIDTEYPLIEHLVELKKRLKYIIIVVLILFVVGWSQGQRIINFIQTPILNAMPENSNLTMLKITEMFLVEVKVSLIAAVMVAMPFILYQLWLFISPGLYMHERKYLYGFVISATFLFLLGASFAYFVVFPFGFKFFLSYASTTNYHITANIAMDGYVSFFMQIILVFGVVFELPAVIFLLAKIGLINEEFLKKYRRYAIVIIFVLGAVLTPPDILSQFAMALPLIILYELSIFIARVFGREPDNIKEVEIYE